MTYVPLARKYRPQTFDELIGQTHAARTLKRALEAGRTAQAYLFSGLRGVGKTSAARILAKAWNCERGETAEPCNACDSCKAITGGSSLDVTEIDGASNRGIDEIRSLRETVGYAPTTSRYHVYIIDEVHMLTTEAFNALLKTLEEPPPHVKFIFATTAPGKVPATILSRCQRFDFRRISPPEMIAHLKAVAESESIEVESGALFAIARESEGSMRDAEVVLDQLSSFVEGKVREADVVELLGSIGTESLAALAQALIDKDPARALDLALEERGRGKEPVEILLALQRHLRNLMLLSSTAGASDREALLERLIDEPPERLHDLDRQAGQLDGQQLILFMQIVMGAYELARRSPAPQTVLEMALVKLATRERWESLEAISRRLERADGPARAAQAVAGAGASAAEAIVPQRAARIQKASPAQPQEKKSAQQLETPASRPPLAPVAGPREGAAVVEALWEIWPHFLQNLGQRKMSLASFLNGSQPVRCKDGVLTIGVPGGDLHKETLETRESRHLVEETLEAVARQRVKVEYQFLKDANEREEARAKLNDDTPKLVKDIVKLFNATVMDDPS